MTKRFCDLCGKPAAKNNTRLEICRRFGEEREDEEYNIRRACVRVSVNFGFRDHPTGFGGPPDLCEECVLSLLDEVKKEAEREADRRGWLRISDYGNRTTARRLNQRQLNTLWDYCKHHGCDYQEVLNEIKYL